MDGVDVAAHDAGRGRNVVGQNPVAAFFGQFRLGIGDDVVGLRGKADDEVRPFGIAVRDGGEDVGIFRQRQGRRLARLLLDLVVARPFGAPVGNGGGEHRDVGGQRLLHRLEHLLRCLDFYHGEARRIGQIDRTGHQHHLGAGRGGGGCNGVALLARGTVGDIAHRIDRLIGRSRCDQDACAGERSGPAHDRFGGGGDFQRLGHAAQTRFAALGHLAGVRPDDVHAVAAQLRKIARRRLGGPHLRIHRRRDQDGLGGREQDRGGEIVGVTARHLGQQIRRRRRDDDEIGVAR